jgi:hypothetical protein
VCVFSHLVARKRLGIENPPIVASQRFGENVTAETRKSSIIVGLVVFYVVRVSKESRQLFLPRTSRFPPIHKGWGAHLYVRSQLVIQRGCEDRVHLASDN